MRGAAGGYALSKAFNVMRFVEGTQVLTATSASAAIVGDATGRNIEQIEPGDHVWARNEFTGEEGYKPVVHVFVNTTDTLVHLTYTTSANATPETLTGTPGHPFWSVDLGDWVGMHELRPGETLLLEHGRTATVTNTRTEQCTTPVKVYNFEVADWHTYHVGNTQTGWVWVHNECTPKQFKKWLNKGPKNTSVYLGKAGKKNKYAGITNDFVRREGEHAGKYDLIQLTDGLTRHQARAVEQALIKHNPSFDNAFNSIDPRREIYDRALKWGEQYLKKKGFGHLLK